jgi:hypothetical protein
VQVLRQRLLNQRPLQLTANDANIVWRVDTKAHGLALHSQDRDRNIFANLNLLLGLSR